MILVAAFALCLVTVPLLGGRLRKLATIRLCRRWTVLAALAIQAVIMAVVPGSLPAGVGPGLHLASYGLTLAFVAANWRTPGMALVTLGGLANLAAIGANGGVMPASRAALELSGRVPPEGVFLNSAVQDSPRLLVLGDIMAVPAGLPLANVFSIGDVLLVVGGAVMVHRAAGSRLGPSTASNFVAFVGELLAIATKFGRPWPENGSGWLSPRAGAGAGSPDGGDRPAAGVGPGPGDDRA